MNNHDTPTPGAVIVESLDADHVRSFVTAGSVFGLAVAAHLCDGDREAVHLLGLAETFVSRLLTSMDDDDWRLSLAVSVMTQTWADQVLHVAPHRTGCPDPGHDHVHDLEIGLFTRDGYTVAPEEHVRAAVMAATDSDDTMADFTSRTAAIVTAAGRMLAARDAADPGMFTALMNGFVTASDNVTNDMTALAFAYAIAWAGLVGSDGGVEVP